MIYFGAGVICGLEPGQNLMKISGYGRTKPLNMKAMLLAEPKTRSKTRYRTQDMEVINMLSGFDKAGLKELSTKIKSLK